MIKYWVVSDGYARAVLDTEDEARFFCYARRYEPKTRREREFSIVAIEEGKGGLLFSPFPEDQEALKRG